MSAPSEGAAASFVYRAFDPAQAVHLPDAGQTRAFARAYPDALLFPYPKSAGSVARDYKWLGSYRYGITHLGGRDAADLRSRCEAASSLLGWPAPYADMDQAAADPASIAAPPAQVPHPRPAVQVARATP
jgi:hypothetical protein